MSPCDGNCALVRTWRGKCLYPFHEEGSPKAQEDSVKQGLGFLHTLPDCTVALDIQETECLGEIDLNKKNLKRSIFSPPYVFSRQFCLSETSSVLNSSKIYTFNSVSGGKKGICHVGLAVFLFLSFCQESVSIYVAEPFFVSALLHSRSFFKLQVLSFPHRGCNLTPSLKVSTLQLNSLDKDKKDFLFGAWPLFFFKGR